MPTLITYHLKSLRDNIPLALHFGRQGIGYEETAETWPSDSLFAALVTQAALLEGLDPLGSDPPAFARPFLSDTPPFVHSSLFPQIGTLTLLPRPALPLPIRDPSLRNSIGKGFKKLRYLSPELFQAICAGDDIKDAPVIMQSGKVWITLDETRAMDEPWGRTAGETDAQFRSRLSTQPIWQIEQIPHVTVDRVSNASAYYEVGRVVFSAGCGLALLVQYNDLAWQAHLESLLALLGDSGIGGKRSSGYGAFTIERTEHGALRNDAIPAARVVLLSRYLPRAEEVSLLKASGSAYNLVNVGGWLFSPGVPGQQRQKITLLAEGSVLAAASMQPPIGMIADVRPDYRNSSQTHPIFARGVGTVHPVYRSGLALTAPVTVGESHNDNS